MQNAMHGDLMGSKSPSFIFDGPDGVGMDGILSDSNDSTSSSTENGLNSFINSAAAGLHVGQLNSALDQSVFHQMTSGVHPSVTNGNYQQHLSHVTADNNKRKHDEVNNGHQHQGHEQPNKKLPPPNGKKTKGRVKIKMEFIDNKLRRYTTFSKRKTGIMKKVRSFRKRLTRIFNCSNFS